jgi:predicted DsbA family dithiol-disulfide isomerase
VAELARAEGLDFDFGAALTVNTLDAHRLLHLAADLGVGDAAKERLLRAHFTVSGAQSDETFLHALRTAYAAEDATTR